LKESNATGHQRKAGLSTPFLEIGDQHDPSSVRTCKPGVSRRRDAFALATFASGKLICHWPVPEPVRFAASGAIGSAFRLRPSAARLAACRFRLGLLAMDESRTDRRVVPA